MGNNSNKTKTSRFLKKTMQYFTLKHNSTFKKFGIVFIILFAVILLTTINSVLYKANFSVGWFSEKNDYLPTDDNQEYGLTFDEVNDNGVKTRTIYTSTKNVQEDGKWKRIENAKSLQSSGVFSVKYMEKDNNYDLDIIDYNWNSITFRPIVRNDKLNQDIPIKVNGEVIKVVNLKNENDGEIITLTFNDSITKNSITIGNHSTTIIIKDSFNNIYCNEIYEGSPGSTYKRSSPEIMDCDDSSKCDRDREGEAWVWFDAGVELNNINIESMELNFVIKTYSDDHSDGAVDVFRSHEPFDPDTITWNNAPHSTHIFEGPKIDEGETVVYVVSGNIQDGFQGTGAYYNLKGDADPDDFFDGKLLCDDDRTFLSITYTECDPSEPCCTETSEFEPEGIVCNPAHDFNCDSADSSGCSGSAHVDNCTGSSGSCPDNNFEISYNSACSGQVCVQQSCNVNTYQPEGTCSDSTCQVGSSYLCSNNFMCNTNTCKDGCSSDADCIEGYVCNLDNQVCIEDAGNMNNLTYDANGNLLQGFGKTYRYNNFNNLVEIKDKDTGSVLESYTYDHNGNRIKKVEFADGGIVTTYYDGDFVRTISSSGTKDEVYYRYNGEIVGKKDSNGNTLFFHPDHLGSTTLITDINGNAVEDLVYEPFGKLIGNSNERYSYEGKELDNSGILYFGARYYDSANLIGFTQPDTIIQNIYDPQTLNRYSFERNNPYRYVDSSGNYFETAIDVGFLIYDVHEIKQNPRSVTNWLALGADVVTTALPFAVGGGLFVRGITKVDDVVDAAKTSKLMRTTKFAEKAVSDQSRLHHAYKHAGELGLKQFTGNARGTELKPFKDLMKNIISSPDKIFTKTMSKGGLEVTGYYKKIDGNDIVSYVFNEGPNKGLISHIVREDNINTILKYAKNVK